MKKHRLIILVLMLIIGALLLLLGFFLQQNMFGTICNAIGSTFLGGGLFQFLAFIYTDSEIEQNTQEGQIFYAAVQQGLLGTFHSRGANIPDTYNKRIPPAKEIDVLGFGLSSFRETYHTKFEEWSKTKRVRILLICPSYFDENLGGHSSFANQRDLEEGNTLGEIESQAIEFVEKTKVFWEKCQSEKKWRDDEYGFQVRLYTTLPSVNIFRFDNEIVWGPYLVERTKNLYEDGLKSKDLPSFLIRNSGEGELFSSLKKHFEALWFDDDKSISAKRFYEIQLKGEGNEYE